MNKILKRIREKKLQKQIQKQKKERYFLKIKVETDADETIKAFDIIIQKLERMLELKKELKNFEKTTV